MDEARALADETGRSVDSLFALLDDFMVTELGDRVAESIPLFQAALGLARAAELPFFADWILVELGEALMALGTDGERRRSWRRPARGPWSGWSCSSTPWRAALGKAFAMAERWDAAEATLAGVLNYARRVGHRQLEQMALRRTAWRWRPATRPARSGSSTRPSR